MLHKYQDNAAKGLGINVKVTSQCIIHRVICV